MADFKLARLYTAFMSRSATRIALVGDFNPDVIAHQAIPKALALNSSNNVAVEPQWLDTVAAERADLDTYDGFWCVPASPYRSMDGALRVIRFAREYGRPFFGSCGGCQHAVLEFARNVQHIGGAGHKETHPTTSEPVITNLVCALIEASEALRPVRGTRFHQIYAADEIRETYHCSYGLNADYIPRMTEAGLRVGVLGPNGEARAVELPEHPFFLATLFQPERSALTEQQHPLIAAFVAAATNARETDHFQSGAIAKDAFSVR
jgi:CTP synthase (UTP-ammonia lyase)